MLSSVSSFATRSFARHMRPLGSRVLVILNKAATGKVGSLYVPETAKEEPNQGTVSAIGSGHVVDGKTIPMQVKVGDKVLLPKFGGQVVKMGTDDCMIIQEDDILAILK